MYYDKYRNKAYKWGGRGPESYDCFGLVSALYKERHGIQISDVTVPESLLHTQNVILSKTTNDCEYVEVERGEGTIVTFEISGFVAHVGFMIDKFRFLHAWKPANQVVLERVEDWKRRIKGFYVYNQNQSYKGTESI